MREVRIELPNHEERRRAINTIIGIADKYDLEYYNTLKFPEIKIIDETTSEIIFESGDVIKCYVRGANSNMESFLAEIKSWMCEA